MEGVQKKPESKLCAPDEMTEICKEYRKNHPLGNDWKLKHSTDQAVHPHMVKYLQNAKNNNSYTGSIIAAVVIGLAILGAMAWLLKGKASKKREIFAEISTTTLN